MLGNVFDLVSINGQGRSEMIDLNYVLPLINGFGGPSFIQGILTRRAYLCIWSGILAVATGMKY
jgi:hypothetical protein